MAVVAVVGGEASQVALSLRRATLEGLAAVAVAGRAAWPAAISHRLQAAAWVARAVTTSNARSEPDMARIVGDHQPSALARGVVGEQDEAAPDGGGGSAAAMVGAESESEVVARCAAVARSALESAVESALSVQQRAAVGRGGGARCSSVAVAWGLASYYSRHWQAVEPVLSRQWAGPGACAAAGCGRCGRLRVRATRQDDCSGITLPDESSEIKPLGQEGGGNSATGGEQRAGAARCQDEGIASSICLGACPAVAWLFGHWHLQCAAVTPAGASTTVGAVMQLLLAHSDGKTKLTFVILDGQAQLLHGSAAICCRRYDGGVALASSHGLLRVIPPERPESENVAAQQVGTGGLF